MEYTHQNLTFTLNEQDIPELMVGHGLTPFGLGRGNFVQEKVMIDESNFNVRAFHLPTIELDDSGKAVTAFWKENILTSVREFIPLYEYFDPATKLPKGGIKETFVEPHDSSSYGFWPGTQEYKFDLYATKPMPAGINMYAATFLTCVDIFCELRYKGIKLLGPDGKFRQPAGAKLVYEKLEGEEPFPYQITVNPVDGVAPFTFSSDGITYNETNVFAFEELPTDGTIYLKDANGAEREYIIDRTKWVIYTRPEPPQ